MTKSMRGILFLAACAALFTGCARSGGDRGSFTENTLYVAKDGTVFWTSTEEYGEGSYKEEELRDFAGAKISQFNQSLGKEAAYENRDGSEALPVALDEVSMKDGRAVLVTEYDTPSRLVEFSGEIGDTSMPFTSIETGTAADLADVKQTAYMDAKGKTADPQALSEGILKESGLAVKVSGQGLISTENRILYVSEGCELMNDKTVKTAAGGVSYIILE